MGNTIAITWDIDDVLNSLTYDWFEEFKLGRSVQMEYEDLAHNPPALQLGISLDEYRASLDSFRDRRYSSLKPKPETLAWFERFGDSFNHSVLSSVPMERAHLSAAWTVKHFGRWIRSFHFVPSPRPNDKFARHESSKADMLARIGRTNLFIDDIEENLAGARAIGVRSLAFPAPWNSNRNEAEIAGLINRQVAEIAK